MRLRRASRSPRPFWHRADKSSLVVAEQPPTFWNTLNAREYGFYSNVNPDKPHPRWSQAEEWLIPDTGNRVPTMLYNGYGEEVSFLYNGDED